MLIGAVFVSFITSLCFIMAFIAAYLKSDNNNLGILTGAVVSNASTIVTFWMGGAIRSSRDDSRSVVSSSHDSPDGRSSSSSNVAPSI